MSDRRPSRFKSYLSPFGARFRRKVGPGRAAAAGLSAAVLLAGAVGCGAPADEARAQATVLRMMGPADAADQYAESAKVCSEQSGGRYKIEYDVSAKQSDDQRLQLARRIVGGDDSFDIMTLDVTWTPEFAEAGWAVPLPDDVAGRVAEGTLSGPLDTAMWKDRLYGAPLNTNTQMLWYRKSLLPESPKTWGELVAAGEKLAEQEKPAAIGVQAAQYEGAAVWLNSLTQSAGGEIVGGDGQTVTIGESDGAQRALEMMHRVATAKGHDPSISQSDENQARLAFDRGDAFAQVNYPFVYAGLKEKADGGDAKAKEIFEDMAWAPYPAMNPGQPAKVTIGGLNLAVPSTSKYKDLAFDAIECLRNEENQLNNALKGGVPPTLSRLYTEATDEFKEEYPFYREIYESLSKLDEQPQSVAERALLPSPRRAGVAVRPKSPAYQSVSILLASRISPPEGIAANSLVEELDEQLQSAVKSEGLVP